MSPAMMAFPAEMLKSPHMLDGRSSTIPGTAMISARFSMAVMVSIWTITFFPLARSESMPDFVAAGEA